MADGKKETNDIQQQSEELSETDLKNPDRKITKRIPEIPDNIEIENIDLNDPAIAALLKDYKPPPEGFDKIGFVRPLGGFFYEFAYAIAVGLLTALTFSFILKTLYPYPDAKAYTGIGNVLFSFLFFIMNIPTEFSLSIFTAKYRVKNPYKLIEFIRFYIWYQMLTGIFLVTGTSIFVLYILKSGNLLYTKWLMLIYISREYPAMTNVFNSALKGLQRFDYQTKVNYAGQLIQPATEFIFVLWGRFVLGRNPVFGEIMGIAIGYAIGTYVDDFITMCIAMYYLRKYLKPIGFTLTETFIPHIRGSVIKEAVIFGLKVSPPGIISTLLSFFSFFWWYDMVPAYAALLVLNETADKIANLIRRGGGIYLKGTFSESLSNGKKKLSEYYVLYAIKFSLMTMIAIATLLITLLPTISEVLFIEAGLKTWLLTTAFIIPNIIESTTEQLLSISSDIILGGNKPGWNSFTQIYSNFLSIFIDYLLLFVLKWPLHAPLSVLIWIIALKDFPNKLSVLIMNYVYIHFRILKVRYKKMLWQAVVAPIPSALILPLLLNIWNRTAYPVLKSVTGVYFAGGITAVLGLLLLLWVYFPLYTFFGGWDDHGIYIFEKAVEISGPSKFLFKPIVWANKLLLKSKLHNRFPIPYKEAMEEAEELMKIRYIKDTIIRLRKAEGG